MAIVSKTRPKFVDYPTSDGKPMAETDQHREQMFDLIETLKMRFRENRRTYVSGNLLVYYVEGDKRRHISPDVFVVKGVSNRRRLYYLLWEEGKAPNVTIEITSKSTRREDLKDKFTLYEQILKVEEYFLYDPFGDYLDPPLRGFRLKNGRYAPIHPVAGRLPSKVLGLHLERVGDELRLYDPSTGKYVPTPREALEQEAEGRIKAEAELAVLRRQMSVGGRRNGKNG